MGWPRRHAGAGRGRASQAILWAKEGSGSRSAQQPAVCTWQAIRHARRMRMSAGPPPHGRGGVERGRGGSCPPHGQTRYSGSSGEGMNEDGWRRMGTPSVRVNIARSLHRWGPTAAFGRGLGKA
eukprot:scaffold102278_cov27-Tisochrysis_lutea.AAC.1